MCDFVCTLYKWSTSFPQPCGSPESKPQWPSKPNVLRAYLPRAGHRDRGARGGSPISLTWGRTSATIISNLFVGCSPGAVGLDHTTPLPHPPTCLVVIPPMYLWASLVAQMVKNLPATQETQVWSLGWEDPWRREWQPTPVFLPGESHGQRNLLGYTVHGLQRGEHNWTTNTFIFHFYIFSFRPSSLASFQVILSNSCSVYSCNSGVLMGGGGLGSSPSRDQTRVSWVSCIGRQVLYH